MISSRQVIEEVWENSFTLFQNSSVKDVIFKFQRLRRSLSVILIVGYFWTETAATREKEGRGFAVQNIFVANCKTSTDSFDLAGGRLFSTIAKSFEIKKKVLQTSHRGANSSNRDLFPAAFKGGHLPLEKKNEFVFRIWSSSKYWVNMAVLHYLSLLRTNIIPLVSLAHKHPALHVNTQNVKLR